MATEESAVQLMKIADIKTAAPFKDLFPVHEGILQDIVTNMQRQGYDPTQPIILWQEEAVVLDGHTRLEAARAAGIKKIPVLFRSCKDEDAALDYAIHLQVDRRNLEDKDVMRLILLLDKREKKGGDRRSADFKAAFAALKTAESTASRIGTSRDKIERARYILDHGDDKMKMLVQRGAISIRSAYNRIQAHKVTTLKCKFTKTAKGVTVSRVALFKALQALLPGVGLEGDRFVEGMHTFFFEPKWIRAYNDFTSISHPLNTGLPALKGGVEAMACYGVVRYMNGDTVELKADAKGLTISDGATTLTLRYVKSAVGEYIKYLTLDKTKWHSLPADFVEAVKVCTFSIGPEQEGVLAAYHVDKDEVMTTDRFRATLYRLDKPMALKECSLKGVFLRQVLRVDGELTHYGISNGWVHFKNSVGTIFSTRALIGRFPAEGIRKVISSKAGLALHRFPNGLRASLERVDMLGESSGFEPDKKGAKLRFAHLRKENGHLLCEAKRKNGEIVDRIKLNPDECPMDIDTSIVARHLMDVLAYTQEFAVSESGMYCHGGNWQHAMITKPSLVESKKEEPKPEKQKLRRPVAA